MLWNNIFFPATSTCSGYAVNTRDIVQVDAEGNVAIIGRSDDVLKIGGKRTSLNEISTAMKNVLSTEVLHFCKYYNYFSLQKN